MSTALLLRDDPLPPAASPSPPSSSRHGLLVAGLILTTWASSLIGLLNTTPSHHQPFWLVVAMSWQTFLYAGLFVTAHDAMHGAVTPQHPRLNRFIGTVVLLLYGLFSYKQLFKTHWQHHHHPATDLDPDFHNGQHKNPFAWYLVFLQRYWSWRRLLALIASFHAMHLLLQVPESNLVMFWIVPSVLSSVQLFYFGTYLPHREPAGGYQNVFRAQSAHRPLLLSLLACYHFGYHYEHHAYPQVPWWQLPAIAKRHTVNE
jgi:beta-carotene/zeaxanthin 4-ketolase